MNRNKFLELIKDGILDKDEMIINFVQFLSEDDMGEFFHFIGWEEDEEE